MYKIITFVPIRDAQKVRQAMGDAGAGKLGNYHHASFSSKGTGRFIPGTGAHPTIGQIGQLTEVGEERIEVVCEKTKIRAVIAAIKKTNPYEEVPIEIYQLVGLQALK